ncbi:UPF0280 family protein [Thermodesulfobacteriota bacterium]
MKCLRDYHKFSYKGANFRICSDRYDHIVNEIIRQRRILSDHIIRQPEFLTALTPIALLPDAPMIAKRMHEASLETGVGPMAAVAGVTAQMSAEAALEAGGREAIVENGGDIYITSGSDVVIGLYAGENPLSGKLGLSVGVEDMPIAVCSSSGKMGHSLSLGDCDLATVTSDNAALADAAATLACNLVTSSDQINSVLEKIIRIPGIQGILIVKDDKIGVSGNLPRLVKHRDDHFSEKVTRDKNAKGDVVH